MQLKLNVRPWCLGRLSRPLVSNFKNVGTVWSTRLLPSRAHNNFLYFCFSWFSIFKLCQFFLSSWHDPKPKFSTSFQLIFLASLIHTEISHVFHCVSLFVMVPGWSTMCNIFAIPPLFLHVFMFCRSRHFVAKKWFPPGNCTHNIANTSTYDSKLASSGTRQCL